MKLLTLLLGCLFLAAVFNFALDVYQQAHFRALTPFLAAASSAPVGPTFDSQLEKIADPAELRQIARQQHAIRLETRRVTAAALGSVDRMNGVATLRGGTVFALTLGALLAAVRVNVRPK